jgi:hypothetical protein
VAPLNRAIAFAEVDHVAVGIGQDLDLDVPWILEVALDVDRRVGEVGLALAARGLVSALGLVRTADDAQPLPAATRGCLDRDRPTELFAEQVHRLDGVDRVGRAGNDRDAGRAHRLARRGLRAHHLDRLGRRADPGEAGGLARARETGVLREEAVTRVDRLSARADGRVEQPRLFEIALRGRP